MNSPRRQKPPFASASREGGVAAAQARQAWLGLLTAAREQAEAAAAGRTLDRWVNSDFAGSVIRVGRLRFPVPHVSAQCAAEGFLIAARGFVAAAVPEYREALGEQMAAGARACERFLIADAHAAAQAGLRRLGMGDD